MNNHVSGKYTRTLICSYRDLCNCNAKTKLDYSMSRHSITLLWDSFGHSHGIFSRLNNRFATFEENKNFVHTCIKLAFTSICNEYHTMIPDYENNLSSSDLLLNDSSFVGFTLNGEIKQESITQCLSKDLEDATKEHLLLKTQKLITNVDYIYELMLCVCQA